jgi:hypothetical protein
MRCWHPLRSNHRPLATFFQALNHIALSLDPTHAHHPLCFRQEVRRSSTGGPGRQELTILDPSSLGHRLRIERCDLPIETVKSIPMPLRVICVPPVVAGVKHAAGGALKEKAEVRNQNTEPRTCTWRTHSCVPRRDSSRRLPPTHQCSGSTPSPVLRASAHHGSPRTFSPSRRWF